MSTPMRDLLEEAAGTADSQADPEAAMRRGDRLRRRRHVAVGSLVAVVVIGAGGVALQSPGGVVIPEVAGQPEAEPEPEAEREAEPDPSELQDDEAAGPEAETFDDEPAPQPEPADGDFQEIAVGQLDDGRAWSARGVDTSAYLCVRLTIVDSDLVDNCSIGSPDGRLSSVFTSHLGDRSGGAPVTVGYIGGDWHGPVEVELEDGSSADADLYPIEGSDTLFYFAEHGDATPTHLVIHDSDGEPRRHELGD